MNKLLVVTVLVTLLALSAESFRMPRQAEEEQGTFTKLTSTLKSYYDSTLTSASGLLESIKDMNPKEKAKTLYTDTMSVVSTYVGIMNDQLYHFFDQS